MLVSVIVWVCAKVYFYCRKRLRTLRPLLGYQWLNKPHFLLEPPCGVLILVLFLRTPPLGFVLLFILFSSARALSSYFSVYHRMVDGACSQNAYSRRPQVCGDPEFGPAEPGSVTVWEVCGPAGAAISLFKKPYLRSPPPTKHTIFWLERQPRSPLLCGTKAGKAPPVNQPWSAAPSARRRSAACATS